MAQDFLDHANAESDLLESNPNVTLENTQIVLITMIEGEFSVHSIDSIDNPDVALPNGLFSLETINEINAAFDALVNVFVPQTIDPLEEFSDFLAAGLQDYNIAPPVEMASPLDLIIYRPTKIVFHIHYASWYFAEARVRLKEGTPIGVFSDLEWVGTSQKTFSVIDSCSDATKPGEIVDHPYAMYVVVAQMGGIEPQETVMIIDPKVENNGGD